MPTIKFSLLLTQIALAVAISDFCKLPCKTNPNLENIGCNCAIRGQRKEIGFETVESTKEFRNTIVKKINELRNLIATGNEHRTPYAPSASNMMAVSYDEDLEYLARCLAGKYYSGLHDSCSRTTTFNFTNELVGSTSTLFDTKEQVEGALQTMYDQVINIKATTIDQFYPNDDPAKYISHFGQIAWWSMIRIGCARVWNDAPKSKSTSFVLVCKYGVTDGPFNRFIFGYPVYQKGQPCSKCPQGFVCNSVYPGLCGEVQAVPTGQVTKIPNGPEEPQKPKDPNDDNNNDDKPPGGGASSINVLIASLVLPFLVVLWK